MSKLATDLSSVTTIGLDIAKLVFQVHGVDSAGRVVVAKAVKRKDILVFFASLPPCLVGLEACGTSHHWGRELIITALRHYGITALRHYGITALRHYGITGGITGA